MNLTLNFGAKINQYCSHKNYRRHCFYSFYFCKVKHLRSLNKYFIKYKWHFLLGVLFVTLSNIFSVLSPQVIRNAIDLVVENIKLYQSFDGFTLQEKIGGVLNAGLIVFAVVYIALSLLKGLFMFLMRQTLIIMSRHIEYDQKNALYAHYQMLTPAFYKVNNTGDLMSRVAEDVGRVRQYVGPAIMYFLNLLVLFTLVIWAMIDVSPLLTLYVLIPLPVLSFSIYYVNHIIERRSELIQAQLSHLTSIAQETFSGIRVIKAYAQENNQVNYFDDHSEIYKARSLDLARVDAMFQPLMVLLIGLSTLITIFIGGWQVMQGNITTGNVAEFVIYVNMLTWPVTSLGWVVSIIQRAAVSQRRINEFMDIEPAIPQGEATNFNVQGKVEFRNVSFTYPDTGIEALKDVSFTVNAGQKVAIIGRTGAGKTTIADLLVRLYKPTSGSILIDDIPIENYSLTNLRNNVSYVPQDVFLFGDTIRNNIAFGMADAPLETIREYARFASIDEEISGFPKGYDTLIGERGVTLSGGQKQRISIARAFIHNTPLIILDDCLSAVDAKTEQAILQNMQQFIRSKTAIVITHRISSLMDYDQIIVLDEHRIREAGTHEDLVKRKGLYYEILETQRTEDRQ